eukprot:3648528-Rhodomonas_salina.1
MLCCWSFRELLTKVFCVGRQLCKLFDCGRGSVYRAAIRPLERLCTVPRARDAVRHVSTSEVRILFHRCALRLLRRRLRALSGRRSGFHDGKFVLFCFALPSPSRNTIWHGQVWSRLLRESCQLEPPTESSSFDGDAASTALPRTLEEAHIPAAPPADLIATSLATFGAAQASTIRRGAFRIDLDETALPPQCVAPGVQIVDTSPPRARWFRICRPHFHRSQLQ